jgi:hypothetical protein
MLVTFGVAVSHGAWRPILGALGGQVLDFVLAALARNPFGDLYGLGYLVGMMAFAGLLGVSARLLQRAIDAEVSRGRAQGARAARERLEARLRFSADAHDAIGHSLTGERMLIERLGQFPMQEEQARVHAELAALNSRSHRQLRELLEGLSGQDGPSPRQNLDMELRRALKPIEQSVRVAALPLRIELADIPVDVDGDAAKDALAIVHELVTNMIRHGDRTGEHFLTVDTERASSGDILVMETRNAAVTCPDEPPHSVVERAARQGGGVSLLAIRGWHRERTGMAAGRGWPTGTGGSMMGLRCLSVTASLALAAGLGVTGMAEQTVLLSTADSRVVVESLDDPSAPIGCAWWKYTDRPRWERECRNRAVQAIEM